MSEIRISIAFPPDGGPGNQIQTVTLRPHEFGNSDLLTIDLPVGVRESVKLSLPRDLFCDLLNRQVR